jgi:hypothetical protein
MGILKLVKEIRVEQKPHEKDYLLKRLARASKLIFIQFNPPIILTIFI